MGRTPTFPAVRRVAIAVVGVVALILTLLGTNSRGAEAQQAGGPSLDETARLLGYLWADGTYETGVWDATGPSGGRELIQQLVIDHGGTWVDQPQLKFTLPAPYDWDDWKGSLPNNDARTRDAVQNPHFLAAVLEGEGGVGGLVYDQHAPATPGFTAGRLLELHQLLLDQGFSTASLTNTVGPDSGTVRLATNDFDDLRGSHQFVCPTVANAVRIPGGQDYGTYGPLQWIGANHDWADVVRTDCVEGQPLADAGVPQGECIVTSDGNGDLRVTWTYKRGTVSIRRNGVFLTAVSAIDRVYLDRPAAVTHSYTVRVAADGLRADGDCGSANPTDPGVPAAVTCMGRIVTHLGTNGNDTITGTSGDDVIHALGGDDEIFALQGNDTVCAGSGDDTVHAGQGDDIVWGEAGFDVLFGAQGNDELRAASTSEVDLVAGARMFGGAGDDTIHGSTRWDRMQGGPGNDVLIGYTGRDWMRGGADNDQVIGGGAIDDLHGGNGTDFIQVQDADVVRGGAGLDGCRYDTSGIPATVISCERTLTDVTAGPFIDALG